MALALPGTRLQPASGEAQREACLRALALFRSGAMNAIPRVALVWLLVAQVLVILPHLAYMPLWIAAMCLGCAAWRCRSSACVPAIRAPGQAGPGAARRRGSGCSRGSLVGLDAGRCC